MSKRKISLFCLPILVSLFCHGQFQSQSQQYSNTQFLVMYTRAAVKKLKIPEHQCIQVSDNGVVHIFTYVDNNLLQKKDSLEVAARNQSLEIYFAIGEGKAGTKKIAIDGLSVCHYYWNRHFMGYGNSLMSVCNIDRGKIQEFQLGATPARTTGFINSALYQYLTAFQLKPNQYIAPHLTDKETLCLVNNVTDVAKDRKQESEKEYKRFQKSVTSIKPYKRLLVRYESKYTVDERMEYTYMFKDK